MTTKLQRFQQFVPDTLRPRTNPMLLALLKAWSGEDDEVLTQLENTKAQLFVKTADGTYLDLAGQNFGVTRPPELGLLDDDFRSLIPNLSLKQKQVTRAFYDLMDVFWGPLFSRVNVYAAGSSPYPVNVGDTLTVRVDNGEPFSVTVTVDQIRSPGAMTAQELVRVLSLIPGITPTVQVDPATGDSRLNIRTNTPGPRGSLEFSSSSTMNLGLPLDERIRISSLDQRTIVYQINAGELVIELPSIVPTLRRTLKGSHHFHASSALESAIPPASIPWQGSFLYSTLQNPFLVTSVKTTLDQNITAGSNAPQITVASTAGFPSSGSLIFNFGKTNQERPVPFISIPNSRTIFLNPGYTFENTHLVNSELNVLNEDQITPYEPRANGEDLAVYLTSPANSRSIVQELLESITAAGITVRFLILLPQYLYLCDNPYEN